MQTDEWIALLKQELSEYRFYHTMCVAQAAQKLAERFGEEEKRAYFGGLVHDLCKDMTKAEQLALLSQAGERPDEIMAVLPQLWHGPCAAVRLQREFGIEDRELLNAVRYHTTGRAGMCLLEKVVFVADAISEDRDYPSVEKIRQAAERSLEEAILLSLSDVIAGLVQKGRPIHRDSAAAYNELTLLSCFGGAAGCIPVQK